MLRAVIVGSVLFVLAGCGGGGGDSKKTAAAKSSPSTPGRLDPAQFRAFRECMTKQGVNLPEQPPDTTGAALQKFFEGIDQQKFFTGLQNCRETLPESIRGGGGSNVNPTALRAYGHCLADHGVNVPDFAQSGSNQPPPTFDFRALDDPKFVEANRVCRQLLPGAGQGAPGGTPTTGQ